MSPFTYTIFVTEVLSNDGDRLWAVTVFQNTRYYARCRAACEAVLAMGYDVAVMTIAH